jgi:hypothetical protein
MRKDWLYTTLVVFALAIVSAAHLVQGQRVARDRLASQQIERDLEACDGTRLKEPQIGQPMCLRLGILSVYPLQELTVREMDVSIDGTPQEARSAFLDIETQSVTWTMVPSVVGNRIEASVSLQPKERVISGYYDAPAWYEFSVTWPTFFGAANMREEQSVEEADEEVLAEAEFNPFPCTWFLGRDYFCNSSTWMSG